MIDIEDVCATIDELEHTTHTSYRLCAMLASLYIVRDHFDPKRLEARDVQLEGSEFLELANAVDFSDLMTVLDDHMENLKLVQPKAYDTVMRKLQDLR